MKNFRNKNETGLLRDNDVDKLPSPQLCSVIKFGFCKHINVLPHSYLGQNSFKAFEEKEKNKQLNKDGDYGSSDSEEIEEKVQQLFSSKELLHLNKKPGLDYLKGNPRVVKRAR